jgi:hypothetical protein
MVDRLIAIQPDALHRVRRERALEQRYADSVIRFVQARTHTGNESRPTSYLLALSYAQSGRAAEAVAFATQEVARWRGSAAVSEKNLAEQILAEVHALLGQDDAAVDQLE